MKKTGKKLQFRHETIRPLSHHELGTVIGAGTTVATTAINCTQHKHDPATTAINCTIHCGGGGNTGPATTAINCTVGGGGGMTTAPMCH